MCGQKKLSFDRNKHYCAKGSSADAIFESLMKKCSKLFNPKCNKGSIKSQTVVTQIHVKVGRTGPVSINCNNESLKGKKKVLNCYDVIFFEVDKNARQSSFFPQKLVTFITSLAQNKVELRQHCIIQNNNKDSKYYKINKPEKGRKAQKNRLVRLFFEKYRKYLTNKEQAITNTGQSMLQEKVVVIRDLSCKIILAGDVELNPGPGQQQPRSKGDDSSNKGETQFNDIDIITYNCRGLKDYGKLKRLLNTCANVIKNKPLSIIFLQETHLDRGAEKRLGSMWRGNFALSPGVGGSRGCVILIDERWQIEDKYEADDD